jgi:LemA protein
MAKKMTWLIPVIVIGVLLVIFFGWLAATYNNLVSSEVSVDTAWSQVENVYQRRADLIPNLVETVKGSANFEKDTQTKIAELRSQALAIKSDIQNARTPDEIEAADAKLQQVIAGYRSLNINVENYPDLKSNQNFLAMQDELANTENKVAVERGRYNEAVRVFNIKVRSFPSNLVAGMFGFSQKTFFKAEAGANVAPAVKF